MPKHAFFGCAKKNGFGDFYYWLHLYGVMIVI